jgi:hypothetical protein
VASSVAAIAGRRVESFTVEPRSGARNSGLTASLAECRRHAGSW